MAKHKRRKVRPNLKLALPSRVALSKREGFILLNEDARKLFSNLVIGMAKCPICNYMMHVQNDNGLQGDPRLDYFVNHHTPQAKILCVGSEKPR